MVVIAVPGTSSCYLYGCNDDAASAGCAILVAVFLLQL